jgi:hypothetical protein
VAALVQHPQHRPEIPGTGAATSGIISGNARPSPLHRQGLLYVALNVTDTSALDHGLATLLHRNPHYHTIEVVPYGIEVPPFGQGTYVIWKYEAHPTR